MLRLCLLLGKVGKGGWLCYRKTLQLDLHTVFFSECAYVFVCVCPERVWAKFKVEKS